MLAVQNPFENPLLADLYAILAGADLMVQSQPGYTQKLAADLLPDLKAWERKGDLTIDLFDSKRIRRLGFYAEGLMEYLLRNHPRFKLLAANRQVIEHGATLGELDFVFKDLQLNQIIHLELAVKFYLKLPEVNGLEGFVGLNRNDTLARKWEKMKSIQLNPPPSWFKDVPGLGGQIPASIPCFKGRLFYQGPIVDHPEINPNHAHGQWIKNESAMVDSAAFCHKLSWLSGVDPARRDFPQVAYNAGMYCDKDQQKWWVVQ